MVKSNVFLIVLENSQSLLVGVPVHEHPAISICLPISWVDQSPYFLVPGFVHLVLGMSCLVMVQLEVL